MNPKTARFVAALLLGATLVVVPGAGLPASAVIDDYAAYDPQSTCASKTLPGTEYLLRFLVRQYPGTSRSSTLRACTEGTSEHKDGRALDWAVDAADSAQKAQAAAFLSRAFATDRAGNPDALARRMGIMYLIWDDHIYSAYDGFQKRAYLSSSCTSVKNCSKTLRHRDHVHISLSRSGAAAQTSFYRARHVPSVPVLIPGTARLDPVGTAIVRFDVPADGSVVTSDFKLTKGTTYRFVGDGLYRYGAGAHVADAACRWSGTGWAAGESLLVNGTSPWSARCDGRHTHVGYYQATRTDFMRLRVADDTARDNEGSVTFFILREDLSARSVAASLSVSGREPRPARRDGLSARGLSAEKVTVRASSARGALTERALRAGAAYRVVVTGTASSGGTRFDGSCVRYAGRFRPQHTLDLTQPAADHLSLFVQGVRVPLRAPATGSGCDGREHRYVGTVRAPVDGRARIKVWDPYVYGDNTGSLTVSLRRR